VPAPPHTQEELRLAAFGVLRLRADNPGPLTLSGTNTWLVGRDPTWVVDPGPARPAHADALWRTVLALGGLGAILLTHDHADHSEGVQALRERFGAPVAAARGPADLQLADGAVVGPLQALALPGHAPDHMALLAGPVCFSGDAVLGEGSVFIAADQGALAGYLNGLRRLRERDLRVICPGHGPPVWDPFAKLDGYVSHRLERERGLLAALARGLRSVDDLLDAAWADVPAELRPAATVTLAAHLDKLGDEGRLPADVQRPRPPSRRPL